MTSKYGSFSPKFFGKFFVVVKIRLFLRLKKKTIATKFEGGGRGWYGLKIAFCSFHNILGESEFVLFFSCTK